MAQTTKSVTSSLPDTTMATIEKRFNVFRNEHTYWHAMQDGNVADFDKSYEAAVADVRDNLLGRDVPCMIDGEPITGTEWISNHSPCDKDLVVARYPNVTRDVATQAINAAKAGQAAWAERTWAERAAILEKAADLYVRDFYRLCAIMTFETGKTRFEASIDVDEAIDFLRFYAFTMREMNGFEMEMGQPVPNERCRSVMKPYGTFSIICPFNFPVAITTGMTVAALVTGNTAVMKPSTKGILAGIACYELLREAGVPADALQFVAGPDAEVATVLTSNPAIDGIVFTGSKKIGFEVQQRFAALDPGRPVVCEMGGKNSITITTKADLDKAVEGVFRSSFGFQGQKCSASSRILVDNSIKDEFLARLKARAEEAIIDEPWKADAFMGPVIEQAKFEAYNEWAAKGRADGTIVTGGEPCGGDLDKGYYVKPTVVTDLARDHALFHTELFLPFTCVFGVDGLDDAIQLANSVEYGLTAGIFTEDDLEAERFFANIRSGVTYRNRKAGGSTAAVVNGQSFVGWKHSGSTGIGAGGRYYLLQFMREQSQTRCID